MQNPDSNPNPIEKKENTENIQNQTVKTNLEELKTDMPKEDDLKDVVIKEDELKDAVPKKNEIKMDPKEHKTECVMEYEKKSEIQKKIDSVEKLYEDARYQKLYGIQDVDKEEYINRDAIEAIKMMIFSHPDKMCTLKLFNILQDDQGNSVSKRQFDFMNVMQILLEMRATVRINERNSWKLSSSIYIKTQELYALIEILGKIDVIILFLSDINLKNIDNNPTLKRILPSQAEKGRTDSNQVESLNSNSTKSSSEFLIIYSPKHSIFQRVQSIINHFFTNYQEQHESAIQSQYKNSIYAKQIRKVVLSRPDSDDCVFILENIERLYPWLENRCATLQRIIYDKKTDRDELRFYRNSYKNGKHKLIYNNIEELRSQIERGAFAFIADCASANNEGQPCGPYSLCIDFDPSPGKLTYGDLYDYVLDFDHYLREYIGFNPKSIVWLHSGNNSFHVRVFMPEFDNNLFGVLLPKTYSFDTYSWRIKDELNISKMHDAVEFLILKYNVEYTKLDTMCQRIPIFSNRNRFKIFADNRTILHGGARVPVSWHTKSKQFCRVFDIKKIPDNVTELRFLCSLDYLKDHTQWLELPSNIYQNKNAELLFSTTSEFYMKNFDYLVNKLHIYNR